MNQMAPTHLDKRIDRKRGDVGYEIASENRGAHEGIWSSKWDMPQVPIKAQMLPTELSPT